MTEVDHGLPQEEDFLARFTLVRSYSGEVADVGEIWSHVKLEHAGGCRYKQFTTDRLSSIDAAFVTARVSYEIYAYGPYWLTHLRYVGKSRSELLEEPLDSLSEEDIKVLESE